MAQKLLELQYVSPRWNFLTIRPEAKEGTCARAVHDAFFASDNARSRIIYNNPNATQQANYYVQNGKEHSRFPKYGGESCRHH
jgi:hypothetical protein